MSKHEMEEKEFAKDMQKKLFKVTWNRGIL